MGYDTSEEIVVEKREQLQLISKDFQCLTCNKMCKNKAGLKAHKRVHSNEYKCDVCQKGFIIKKNFILHKKNYHSKICNECGKECLTALALKTHERKCFMK